MKKITLLGTALLSIVCLLTSTTSFGQTGSLDITFDTDGKVTTAVSPFDTEDNAKSVAIQSDGKIVAVGYSLISGAELSTDYDFAVVRYNTDGSLDTDFDTDGKVTTDISGNFEDQAYSVAIQSDGKIVVAGYSLINGNDCNIIVVRYNQDGSLDASFDSDGIVSTDIFGLSEEKAYSLAIQSDGKIVVAGYSLTEGYQDFAVVRYNSDGSLDTGFDSDGIVTTPVGSYADLATCVVIQSDGKIVATGQSLISGNDYDFSAVRYNSDGSLDTSFDTDGKVITAIAGTNDDRAYSAAIQSDGKIVVVGYTYGTGLYHYALVRYNTDGSLDASFDSDGIAITVIGNLIDIAYAVAIQNDGKIVAAGYSYNPASNANDFALVSYNSDGSLNTNCDTDGIVTTPIGPTVDMASAMAIQGDGKIVVVGQSLISVLDGGSTYDFSVVRYNSNTSGLNTIENQDMSIFVYPNPATYNLTISTTEPTEISICTINGIVILNKVVDKEQIIDLTNFASGVYFVRTSEGLIVKFIKE
jgi:uncharacterized delta-60 repeat protein